MGYLGEPVTPPSPEAVASAQPAAAPPGRSKADAALLTVLTLLVWLAVVYLGRVWGMYLEYSGHLLTIYTYPILGGYRVSRDPILLVPIVVGALFVAGLSPLATRLHWRLTLLLGATSSLVWWVALAMVDGSTGLTNGLNWHADLEPSLPGIAADPHGFLSGFTSSLSTYGIQIRAHPPGLPLLLAGLDRIGLRGPGWAAVVVLASAALGIVAVLVAVREVAGEDAARRALPFLTLAPAALWIATSFDALYLGVAAWFVTFVVLATRRTGRKATLLAVAAGLCGAAMLMLSYGLVLLGASAVLVVVAARAWRVGAITVTVAATAIVAFLPLGFWWPAGLLATKEQYYSLGLDRPYYYFVLNNLSALALVIGPATAVALTRMRDRRMWLLVGGGLIAIVAADISGLSNGEVERIWLPFSIWVIAAGAVLGGRPWATRGWLALQATTAVVITALIRPYW